MIQGNIIHVLQFLAIRHHLVSVTIESPAIIAKKRIPVHRTVGHECSDRLGCMADSDPTVATSRLFEDTR